MAPETELKGNRYSMDGSYDMPKDYDFPVSSELLWPEGKLLQLQYLGCSSHLGDTHLRGKTHIVYLLPRELVIAVETESEMNPPWEPEGMGDLYRFYTGGTKEAVAYDAKGITRVELKLSAMATEMGIWATDRNGRTKKVFVTYGMGIPNTFVDLAARSVQLGIGSPRPDGFFRRRGMTEYANQLLYREVEKQFRRAAPQAEVVLTGHHMSPEEFRRVIR